VLNNTCKEDHKKYCSKTGFCQASDDGSENSTKFTLGVSGCEPTETHVVIPYFEEAEPEIPFVPSNIVVNIYNQSEVKIRYDVLLENPAFIPFTNPDYTSSASTTIIVPGSTSYYKYTSYIVNPNQFVTINMTSVSS